MLRREAQVRMSYSDISVIHSKIQIGNQELPTSCAHAAEATTARAIELVMLPYIRQLLRLKQDERGRLTKRTNQKV